MMKMSGIMATEKVVDERRGIDAILLSYSFPEKGAIDLFFNVTAEEVYSIKILEQQFSKFPIGKTYKLDIVTLDHESDCKFIDSFTPAPKSTSIDPTSIYLSQLKCFAKPEEVSRVTLDGKVLYSNFKGPIMRD